MDDLPDIAPSPAGRADAAAIAALALIPPDVAGRDARTLELAALAAAAIAASRSPAECLGTALRGHLAEARASRHGSPDAPERPTRDEVAAFAGPVAVALRETRRRPPPHPAIARRVRGWCDEHGCPREAALADLVRAILHASRWTGAAPGLVVSAALQRLPGPPGAGLRILEGAVTVAVRDGPPPHG